MKKSGDKTDQSKLDKLDNHDKKREVANKLVGETSTYLLQHAYNPVHWYPWGEEALSRSKAEDKPILLSIGYAACHWCHVMEHESFEDVETAKLMNEWFINIKVDREERPDLDEIYMKAVQLMTGHGGWPMTVFLTPSLNPFFGGTYFPPNDRHGLPGFKRLLIGVNEAWHAERKDLEASSTNLTEHMKAVDLVTRGAQQQDNALDDCRAKIIEPAVAQLIKVFDQTWGGFGSAPKFPQVFSLMMAMRCASGDSDYSLELKLECEELIATTLDRMAYGGIHDQIGGGFARYSVDRQWLVPHFEKMLYDNALLATTYFDGYLLLDRPYWAQVGQGILDFALRDLLSKEGAFYSSLDADSEGEEGKFYVFTPKEIRSLLGDDEGDWFCEVFGVTEAGNFEHGKSVLHMARSLEATEEKFGMTSAQFLDRLNPLKEKLLTARAKRIAPGRDEKVLTSWNSLMISALVKGFKVLRDQKYLDAAKRACDFLLSNLTNGPRILRTWGQGKAKLKGYLDDYAYLSLALLDLASADPDPKWFSKAMEFTQFMLEHFYDKAEGAFYYTSDEHEKLITKPRSHYDGSIPSGTSAAAFAVAKLARLTGRDDLEAIARSVVSLYAPFYSRMADQLANLLSVLDFLSAASMEVAIVGDAANDEWQEFLFALESEYIPNKVLLVKDKQQKKSDSPLLDKRLLLDNKPTVYICHNFTCEQPINDLDKFNERLAEL